jgi:hypothetical protein
MKDDSSYIHLKHPTKQVTDHFLVPPWMPLCETEEPKPLLFYALEGALRTQAMSDRLCPKCAAHPDFPLMLLGEM